MSGSDDLLGDLVAEAQQGARGETGALELLERETEMRKLSKKAKTIIAGAAIAGLASTGVAYAYWTTTGSGPGTATTGSAAAIDVNQTSPITGLTPGGAAQTLLGDFTNANTAAVSISSVTAVLVAPTNTGTDLSKPLCTVADYQLGGTAAGSLVPTGVGVGEWTGLTIRMVQRVDTGDPFVVAGSGNQDNCKGAVIHITYTANP